MILPFELPLVGQDLVAPIWDGKRFILGRAQTPVLEYSENFVGWSDDLTSLHEEVAGDSHPIDCASRYDAILQIKKAISVESPVIMEIGCSSGFLLQEIVSSFPGAITIGADVVKAPLYRLAEKIPGIPLIRFDLLQCTLPDQIIDVLVMINVLEHIEDDVSALKNAFNLLKPGGSLVIEVPAAPYLYDSYDKELCHFRRYSAAGLQEKMLRAGFEIYRKSHIGFMLFPAFAVSKILNKITWDRSNRDVVRSKIKSTSENYLVKKAVKFESKYLSDCHLPFGIRVVMTVRKPI